MAFGHDLADFITGVRAIDTRGRTFARAGRGGDLRAHDAWMEECFQRSADLVDVPGSAEIWTRLRDLPRTSADVMTHGDLTPGNVLVTAAASRGSSMSVASGPQIRRWTSSPPGICFRPVPPGPPRGPGQRRHRVGRGQAWAFEQAMEVVWYYAESNPVMHRMGRTTLQRILDS